MGPVETQLTARVLASSTISATALRDVLNAAMRGTAQANGAVIVDIHALANGPDRSAAGWYSANHWDLDPSGQDAFAAEIAAAGVTPLDLAMAR